MDESNTVVSAYTTYKHLQQYCSHPSICEMYLIGQNVSLVAQETLFKREKDSVLVISPVPSMFAKAFFLRGKALGRRQEYI